MDFAIYGILRSGTTVLSDLLTVKDKSLVLYEPDILFTSYKNEKQDADGHESIFKSLECFGIDVSEIKCWDKTRYPTFLQFFDATMIVALGLLEYVTDISGFIKELREKYELPVIISYHPLDNILLEKRTELGWLNHLRKSELKLVLQNSGLYIELEKQIDDTQTLIIAKPNKVKK